MFTMMAVGCNSMIKVLNRRLHYPLVMYYVLFLNYSKWLIDYSICIFSY
jgi:hypothetical protein